MTDALSEADADRVRELIKASNLEGVFFHEQSAARHEETPGDLSEDAANVEVGIQYRLSDDAFGIRVKVEVQNTVGRARVVVSAEYSLADGYAPTKRDVMMFANEVAVMVVYPYLREGVSDATLKVLGQPVFLPIAPRGTIAFDIEAETASD